MITITHAHADGTLTPVSGAHSCYQGPLCADGQLCQDGGLPVIRCRHLSCAQVRSAPCAACHGR